ncbi:MAG TPA: CoA transferase subunit A [Dehalococcoidia bacterium]|nr:CoA transferase subunit A [Dehalococcoidia bacterium]
MQNKVIASFAEAVADIADGSSILLGGFGPGTPHNLIGALCAQGAKDLHLISNTVGGAGLQDMPQLKSGMTLVEEGRVRKVTCCFSAPASPSRSHALQEQDEAGEIEVELIPQGTLAERIRAGGAGIPAFYTPAAVGTVLGEGRETRFFDGREYLLEEAIFADYAFVRAWRADEFGNLVFRRAQRNFNPLMATAARCTIVEAEEIVPVGTIDPDHIHTSGIFVSRTVLIGPDDILHVRRISR